MAFEWTTSDTVTVALNACSTCRGSGLVTGLRGGVTPCKCALRGIFRKCYAKFQSIQVTGPHHSQVTLGRVGGGGNRRIAYGRKDEEYCADFILIAKRTLTPINYKIFTWNHLLSADWNITVPKLNALVEPGMPLFNRGLYFHAVYRVEEYLGKAFKETMPYPLYPVGHYYGVINEGHVPAPKADQVNPGDGRTSAVRRRLALRAPLRTSRRLLVEEKQGELL